VLDPAPASAFGRHQRRLSTFTFEKYMWYEGKTPNNHRL
jgi:hypothetical protein